MLSREHRFSGPKSLKYVYQKGATTRGPQFSVKTALNHRRSTYRAAVVISRKVHKSAVARNRIRRRLYEALRHLEDDISQPYDIVLTVFNDAVLQLPPDSLDQQLKNQLKAAGVLAKT